MTVTRRGQCSARDFGLEFQVGKKNCTVDGIKSCSEVEQDENAKVTEESSVTSVAPP